MSFAKIGIKVDNLARLTQADLDSVAKYDLLITSLPANWNKLQIEYLQSKNPNLAIYGYVFVGGVWKSETTVLDYLRSQDWLLKDAEGNEWNLDPKFGDKAAYDIGNPDCRAYIINLIKEQITNVCNITGMFADGTNTYIPLPNNLRPINPRTGQFYTDAEWNADLISLIKDYRRLTQKPWLANGAGLLGAASYYPKKTYADPVIDAVDGVLVEGWTRWENTDLRSEREWKANLDYIQMLVSKDKLSLAWVITYGNIPAPLTKQQVFMYGLVSYHLVNATTNIIFVINDVDFTTDISYYQTIRVPLGNPQEPYHLRTDVPIYERSFSKSLVLVNPTDTTYTVNLKLKYKTLEGKVVSSVTLPPKTSVILHKCYRLWFWLWCRSLNKLVDIAKIVFAKPRTDIKLQVEQPQP